jgi:inhibitor of KinA
MLQTPTMFDLYSCKVYPLGDTAIVVEFGQAIDISVHARVISFAAYLEKHPFRGMIEYVPAYTTVTIYYDLWIVSEGGKKEAYGIVENTIRQILPAVETRVKPSPGTLEIPVCYGGEFGPDLPFVAGYHQLTEEEVIHLHTSARYQVFMIGFAPGFPYLGGMHPAIATPRKEIPRPLVPAGSVGIADSQTGVYSLATPGGWQLIGRTRLSLFDPGRQDPSLLKAGDVVRFVPIGQEEYRQRKEQQGGH